MTTGHPLEVPVDLRSSQETNSDAIEGQWRAKSVACGGRHTLSVVEWQIDEQ